MEICTIGASGTSAKRFFSRLKTAGVTCLVDTRLHPSSQLAGFAKKESLSFFLAEILGVGYIHEPLLAPRKELLKAYRAGDLGWEEYERAYREQLDGNQAYRAIDTTTWGHRPVFLCSENSPDSCHRRLAAEYLQRTLTEVSRIEHLRA